MAATIEEIIASRSSRVNASGRIARRVYRIQGTADDNVAHNLLRTTAPSTHTVAGVAVPRSETSIEDPEFVDEVTGKGIWTGTADYAFPGSGGFSPQPVDTTVFNFEFGTTTERVLRSEQTIARHSAEDNGTSTTGATDYGGLVNVGEDGPEGVDIISPQYGFSLTCYITDAALQAAKSDISTLIGKVNDATFQGFAAGEVILIGVSGSRRADEETWEVTFSFRASPNRTTINIASPLAPGGNIVVASKKGWEYLWVRYVPHTDTGTGFEGQAAEGAYVERTYDDGDFTALPIPA